MSADRLAEEVLAHCPHEGLWRTPAAGLGVYRFHHGAARTLAIYQMSLCVVAQGQKRSDFGGQAVTYGVGRGLYIASPRSAEATVVEASEEVPLLGLVLELSHEQILEIALEIAESRQEGLPGPRDPSPWLPVEIGDALTLALTALLRTARDPVALRVVYPAALRQVIFHLLTGPDGDTIQRMALKDERQSRLLQSVRFIDGHFREELRVADLARGAGMSESSYYQRFREMTGVSPLQYVKQVRLQMARILLLSGAGVSEAAFEVGYNNASQFSRDFREAYGHPPSQQAPAPPPHRIEAQRVGSAD